MRRLLVAAVVLAGVTATASSAATRHVTKGPLTGTWKGVLTDGTRTEHITFTVNAGQNAGTWTVSATCHGALTLDSISDGYHHYRRHNPAGSVCTGGGGGNDVDCLKRVGANVYDSVTPRAKGWWRDGTLHRVSAT